MTIPARLSWFTLLVASLATAVSADAEKATDVAVIKDRAGIEASLQSYRDTAAAAQQQQRESGGTYLPGPGVSAEDAARVQRSLHDLAHPARLPRHEWFDDWRHDPHGCRVYGDCQPDTLPLEQLRVVYRDVPESELWKICLGRRGIFHLGPSRAGACMMISIPDPLRPGEVPRQLENARNTRAQQPDFALELTDAIQQTQRHRESLHVELEITPQSRCGTGDGDHVATEDEMLELDSSCRDRAAGDQLAQQVFGQP